MARNLTISALLALALLSVCAVPSVAKGRSCHYTYGNGPRNDRSVPLGGVTVRHMSCSSALHAISHGKLVGGSQGLRTHGFGCRALKTSHVGNETTGQVIRCRAGRRTFRFSWST
jgi:hypothetical protein